MRRVFASPTNHWSRHRANAVRLWISPDPGSGTYVGARNHTLKNLADPPVELSHQVPIFESRFSRLARPSRQAYEKVVERDDSGSCDRQPQEQGKILELVES